MPQTMLPTSKTAANRMRPHILSSNNSSRHDINKLNYHQYSNSSNNRSNSSNTAVVKFSLLTGNNCQLRPHPDNLANPVNPVNNLLRLEITALASLQ